MRCGLIDRNPQTLVASIFEAKAEEFRVAAHQAHRSARFPSHVVLPVATGEATAR